MYQALLRKHSNISYSSFPTNYIQSTIQNQSISYTSLLTVIFAIVYTVLFIIYTTKQMGNNVCQTCETIEPAFNYIHTRTFRSIEDMEVKFRKYAQDNLLSLYGRRMQQNIEKLFTFEQFHLCDLLIKLSCEKKIDEVEDLLLDIQDIDFQELDHLTLIQNVPTHLVERIDNISNVYYYEQKDELPALKTVMAKNIQNKQLAEQTIRDMLQNNKFAVVATVQCLSNSGAFDKLQLPTHKNPLQMFVQKVQAINTRYHCAVFVVFVVNPRFEKQFEQQMDKLTKYRDFQSNGDTETTVAEFKYQKILYKPLYPCVNEQRKIIVQNNKIKFDQYNGDFVGFFMRQTRMQNILHRFQYLQVANINSLTQKIADRNLILKLIWQHMPKKKYTLYYIKNELTGKKETIKVKKNFVERVKSVTPQQLKKPQYNLMQTFYLKAELFFQKEKHTYFHKLISTRIKSNNFKELGTVFTRHFDNILYAPITLIILDEQNEVVSQKNKQFQYSNFCKKKLGITDTLNEEMVQVCPYLLFGSKQELKKVVSKLRTLPQIGFPLVINKQKIEEVGRSSQPI